MSLRSLLSFAALAFAVVLPAAHADSIVLSAQSGNSYTYDLLLTNASSNFSQFATLTVTGLTGVTRATSTSSSSNYGLTSYTSTSATFQTYIPISSTGGFDLPLFIVTSTSATQAAAHYAFTEQNGSYSGAVQSAVQNPPASPPVVTVTAVEPAGFLLIGTGFSGVFLLRRSRYFHE